MLLCRALPVDVLAHMPRLLGAGSDEAPAQGSSLESLEVGWAAARGGAAASLPPAPDNMAGLNSGRDNVTSPLASGLLLRMIETILSGQIWVSVLHSSRWQAEV